MDSFDNRLIKEFQELERQMGRMLRNMSITRMTPVQNTGGWRPAVDVYETVDAVYIYLDTAGIDMEGLTVTAESNGLTVSGRRQLPGRENVCCIHQLEIELGRFSRTITFPVTVDAAGIALGCRNGILEIRLPKMQPSCGVR